jgi:trehalose 6-phosphate phosphatase
VRYLLAPGTRRLLDAFARPGTLLAFDFDGTIAPLVADRRRARIAARTRSLLARVAAAFPCVVISGRGRRDVAARCSGIPFVAIVGNHGLEPSPEAARFRGQGAAWTRTLHRALRQVAGVSVENKGYTVSVHYRQALSKAAARRAISVAAARLSGAAVAHGIDVVNLIPVGAPDKADALRRLKRRFRCRRSLFFGDDVTDEAVFAAGSDAVDLGVRVGRDPRSLARFYVRDREEVDQALRLLLDAAHRTRAPAA